MMRPQKRRLAGFLAGGLALALALGSTTLRSAPSSSPAPCLSQTGLYEVPARFKIAPHVLSYAPQYPLWSDGAKKLRWICLPPGEFIDASNPDVWEFPRGTKVWKEFSFNGRRVETRLLESLGDGDWRAVSYAWRQDGTDADLVPPQGQRDAAEIMPGVKHDIPGYLDCRACHVSRRFEVLGFSALQLSSDRDPNAVHGEKLRKGMVTLRDVIERGLLRSYPDEWAVRPPRIEAASPRARAALGYLHANCGNCHNPGGPAEVLDLILRHTLAQGGTGEPALVTGLGRTGRFWIPGLPPGETFLILPGHPERSALAYRMFTRNPYRQMPPLGTKLVDEEGLALVRSWIENDLATMNHPSADRSSQSKGGL